MYLVATRTPQYGDRLHRKFRGEKTVLIARKFRRNLLKMLAVMEAGSQAAGPSGAGGSSNPSEPPIQEFLSSGRTGRRNALPDILGQHAIVTTTDLPSRLQALSTKDQGSSSSSNEPQPGPSSAKS